MVCTIESKVECNRRAQSTQPLDFFFDGRGLPTMKHLGTLVMMGLLWFFPTGNLDRRERELATVTPGTLTGKVFRSDTNQAISNSYILIMQEVQPRALAKHFDLRTDEKGHYRFNELPPGPYTISIYSWSRKRSDVPCQNPLEAKTIDDGKVTVEWQRKSEAFMEIVTIKGFSIEANRETFKDFDLSCK